MVKEHDSALRESFVCFDLHRVLCDVDKLRGEIDKLRDDGNKRQDDLDKLREGAHKLRDETHKLRTRINQPQERHAFLAEEKFGVKPHNETWEVFLMAAYCSDSGWFKGNELGFGELALLAKAPMINAAHQPPRHLVERAVHEAALLDDTWTSLWECAQRA
ncbi:hypothetical protein TSOC_004067 [Tetrabaena socialis]|uniref:Uncharacterized protein n=1 Tax=Tetrabaena socialis TaxID=47790 RepID=A0A2J8A9X7_9CHLO|nr:hypothetical protein TSOC_004067 [Tetrabaena socialis]|eukprot:PNH09320.1 hypothetical protein TSOC_004067 [Tetrabaena socialis]